MSGAASYTIIDHEPLDSLPGRSLSPGAFRLYVDFQRLWKRETRNETRNISSVIFVWSACNWSIHEKPWNNHRRELEAAGFVDCVSRKSGHFRASKRWQDIKIVAEKDRKLTKIDLLRKKRIGRSKAFRSLSKGQTTPNAPEVVSQNDRLPEESVQSKGQHDQSVKMTAQVVCPNDSDPITFSFGEAIPPLPPCNAQDQKSTTQKGGGGGGIAPQSEKVVSQVPIPDPFTGIQGHWKLHQKYQHVVDMCKEARLGKLEAQNHIADVFLNLWNKRGDKSGRWRIISLREKKFSWKEIGKAIEDLYAEKTNFDDAMKFLEHRAKIQKGGAA